VEYWLVCLLVRLNAGRSNENKMSHDWLAQAIGQAFVHTQVVQREIGVSLGDASDGYSILYGSSITLPSPA
jgi:hypothetical protein